jgi:hypothetical protein
MGDALGPFFGECKSWSHESAKGSLGNCKASLSTGTKVAIGVAVPVAVILIVVIVVVVCRRKKPREIDTLESYDALKGFR